MRRNFIIIYTGREGSSPIVSALKKHPHISIPLFEHLDKANLKEDQKDADFCKLLSYIFSTGKYIDSSEYGNSEFPDKEEETNLSVGFKWRPFLVSGVLDTLANNNVVVFMLMRRRLLTRALSMYFTHEHLKEGHLQFKMLKMDENARREKIIELQSEEFKVDIEILVNTMRRTLKSKIVQWKNICKPYHKKGGLIVPLFYEDFLDDSLSFTNNMLRVIGRDAFAEFPEIQYKKVNRQDIEKQVTNLDEVISNPEVQTAITDYDSFILDAISCCVKA